MPVRWGSTMMVFRAAPWWLEPGSLRYRQLTRELVGRSRRCRFRRSTDVVVLHALCMRPQGTQRIPGYCCSRRLAEVVRVSGCRRRVKVNWNRITNRLCEVGAGVCETTTGPAPASGCVGRGSRDAGREVFCITANVLLALCSDSTRSKNPSQKVREG